MKVIFDQNLSPHFVGQLSDLFPDSSHRSIVGLERAGDGEVWAYARANDFIIVTKDADFGDATVMQGFPPKVIWLQLGNCTTRQIADALRSNYSAIAALGTDSSIGILTIV